MPIDFMIEQTECAEHIDSLRGHVEAAMATLVPSQDPVGLYDPVRYVLAGRGKRVRPLLALLGAESFGVETARAMPVALAVEVFHNFTLVHDDIMDHAPERRGRPTVHVRWDADTAILCGDYLLALSYDLLARTDVGALSRLLTVFSEMVARLCEGQTLDKSFETRRDVSVEDYLHMIDCKTGALLQAALAMGGLAGGAGEHHVATLREIGKRMGRAFQIQDDLLDLVADDTRWGKSIGGDLMAGKKTFLLLASLERARSDEREWFARIVHGEGLPAHEVGEARRRMERLGVLDEARAAVLHHTERATDGLASLPQGPAIDAIRWLILRMQARVH